MNIIYVPHFPIHHRRRQRELALFIGGQLRGFRHRFKLSRDVVARKTGFSEAAIRSYETGRRMPNTSFWVALQQAFSVSLDYFLPLDEDEIWAWKRWR